jgi:hypothetical protein
MIISTDLLLFRRIAKLLGISDRRFAVFSCPKVDAPDSLLSRAECAGTRKSASKGHHWFLSSNPVFRGPGRLKSNSRCVFCFPRSWTYVYINIR